MKTSAFLVHALTPLHAGVGDSTNVVDLPIARMKATGIPFVPGSSLKGVLRDVQRERPDKDRVAAVFGPPSSDADAHAGALVLGDARLFALPVQSFRGTFAWVTSPLLMFLARRDILAGLGADLGTALSIPQLDGRSARVSASSACVYENRVFLEDIDLDAAVCAEAAEWAKMLAPLVSPGEDVFTKRFVIIDDDTMAFFCETGMQVDARVRIDETTRTVAKGALWLEESLPPETVLLGLCAADQSRKSNLRMAPEEVLDFALPGEQVVQLGGKASTGRGRCRLLRLGNAVTARG